jgi:hypothetical protein
MACFANTRFLFQFFINKKLKAGSAKNTYARLLFRSKPLLGRAEDIIDKQEYSVDLNILII